MNIDNQNEMVEDSFYIEKYRNFLYRTKDYETGWTREERYLMNVAAMKRIEALDNYT